MAIASSAVITKTKVLSQAYANVYNLINNRSNVSDPAYPEDSGTTRTRSTFIISRLPDLGGPNFRGYPFVVVSPATADFDRQNSDGSISRASWQVVISVYSSDRSNVGVGAGKGMEHMDSVCDDLVELFNSTSAQATLQSYGMFKAVLDVNTVNVFDQGGERVFFREFVLTFENYFQTG